MFWNESDRKKYGFVLVLFLFRDISSFKSEKGDNTKVNTCTANCNRFILKHISKF